MDYSGIWQTASKCVYMIYPCDDKGDILHYTHVDDGSKKIEKAFYGTAFAISSSGLFLTASHVIKRIRKFYRNDNPKLAVKCIRGYGVPDRMFFVESVVKEWDDDKQDVALLKCKVDAPLDFLKIRTRGLIESPGRPVAAIGYPLAKKEENIFWVTQRTFSGNVCAIPKRPFPSYEVDALFNEGLSGGPLISLVSEDVIGVVHGFDWHASHVEDYGTLEHPTNISQARVLTECNDSQKFEEELENAIRECTQSATSNTPPQLIEVREIRK